ncbi:glutamate receptor ionotropic, NMDA 3A-like [Clytia hemisphaerica]|uniref:Uncharacterized protein n=1 Tax=Clytia hemisphaerica TaxID=252671 RepID=A0A7M5WS35_9CNID
MEMRFHFHVLMQTILLLLQSFQNSMMVQTSRALFYLPQHMDMLTVRNHGNSSMMVNVGESLNAMLNASMTENVEDFGLSFLNKKNANIVSELKKFEGKMMYRFDKNLCKFRDSNKPESCYPQYREALEGIYHYFRFSKSIIIHTMSPCDAQILQTLNKTFESRSSSTIQEAVVNLDSLTQDISKLVYQIKVSGVDLVISLLEPSLTEMVLEAASRYELLDYSLIWITLSLHQHIAHVQTKQLPWQWIDFRLEEANMETESIKQSVEETERTLQNTTFENTSDILEMEFPRCDESKQKISIYARNSSTDDVITWGLISEWTSQRGIHVYPDANLLVRMIRIKTSLTTLRIATVLDDPFASYAPHLYNPNKGGSCDQGLICRTAAKGYPSDHPDKWENKCCVGMAIDLIELISEELYFTPDLYIVEDGFYGGKDKNTSEWNGLVRDVQLHKADIAIAALTATADRLKIVDFCEPFLLTDLGIMISTIHDQLDFINWEFLAPLSTRLRVWILVTFIIGVYLIYILENQHLVLQRIIDKGVFPRYQWREGFSYFSGLTFQRDLGGKNPQRAGARVTAVAFAFGMVIIMTTYTAVLTASKVSQSTSNPFHGFDDERVRNPSSDFKFGTVSHTSMESFFKNSRDDIHQRMFRFMLNYNVNQSLEGIDMVRKGKLNAFIHETPFLTYHASKQSDCSLKIFGNLNQGGYAFSVPKNSVWKHLLSQAVLKLKEQETIEDLYKKWFPFSCANNGTSSEYEPVQINYFGGLFFILLLVLILSLFLLGGEHFCYRHHRRVINPIQDKVQVWRETKATERRNAIINPDDISRLQQLHQNGMLGQKDPVESAESSSEGDISEGEEELIRMRLGRRNVTRPSVASSVQRTSLDSLGQYFATDAAQRRRGSRLDLTSIKKSSNFDMGLSTTLELSEISNISEANNEDCESLRSSSASSLCSNATLPNINPKESSRDINNQSDVEEKEDITTKQNTEQIPSPETENSSLELSNSETKLIPNGVPIIVLPNNKEQNVITKPKHQTNGHVTIEIVHDENILQDSGTVIANGHTHQLNSTDDDKVPQQCNGFANGSVHEDSFDEKTNINEYSKSNEMKHSSDKRSFGKKKISNGIIKKRDFSIVDISESVLPYNNFFENNNVVGGITTSSEIDLKKEKQINHRKARRRTLPIIQTSSFV